MSAGSVPSQIPQVETVQESRFWAVSDGAGALASILCMIHCVGIPLLLAAFPGFSFGFMEGESFHKVVAVLAAVFALSAFSRGYREHHSRAVARAVVALGILGCSFLFIAAWWGNRYETMVTVFGSMLLIGAHLINFRYIKKRCSHPEHAHAHVH